MNSSKMNISMLYIASKEGDIEMVKLLLEKGADPNKFGGCGETPLTIASKEGHVEIVKLLLVHGISFTGQVIHNEECVVCMSAESDMIFPCGHLCVCKNCNDKLIKEQCVLCRKPGFAMCKSLIKNNT